MKIYSNVMELIGKTPLVQMQHFANGYDFRGRILGKLERQNPGGSAKDRAVIQMVKEAKKNGTLYGHGMIIAPTSGNTGIGLAIAGSMLGYRAVVVMPDNMTVERQKLIKAYGAKLVLTPAEEGMEGAIRKAHEMSTRHAGSIVLDQFADPANAEAHYLTTGPEIWEDTDGDIDIFVCPVGTGGTITGVGRYLKEKNPNIKVVAVEPKGSPVLSGGKAGPHKIQGIGAGFVPEVLDTEIYDEVMTVKDEEAKLFMREAAKSEAMLVGLSSGAALCAAAKLCGRAENAGKTIVVLLPDSGERYLSVLD